MSYYCEIKCVISSLFLSVCYLYVFPLPVCVFPPRCEERVEDVPSVFGGGDTHVSAGRRLGHGVHRAKERL